MTMLVLGIVAASISGVFLSLQRSEAFARERTETLDRMRIAMDTMTKEVRQATALSATSDDDRLEMDTYVLGVSKHIVFGVTGDSLTRQVGSNPAVVIQEKLADADPAKPLFAYTFPPEGTVEDSQVVTVILRVHPPDRKSVV